MTSVLVTLVDQASQAPSGTAQAYLLVSANSGATWTAVSIATPTPTPTLATQVVNVTAVLGSAVAVSGLELRYVVSDTSAFISSFDLVHVDVN